MEDRVDPQRSRKFHFFSRLDFRWTSEHVSLSNQWSGPSRSSPSPEPDMIPVAQIESDASPTTENAPPPLPSELFRVGQAVALIGDDISISRLEGEPLFLYRGHPGRITDPNDMHVLTDWVGLEESPWSFAFGFTAFPDGTCRGLTAITDEDYAIRAKAIADGKRPTTDNLNEE
jgi:hypothetical protein